uniref:Metallo-beta-lactamase domain-containing protein n=1 Tax=Anopheles merus TaxID=30066 RepID=A0A182VFK7_ANOME
MNFLLFAGASAAAAAACSVVRDGQKDLGEEEGSFHGPYRLTDDIEIQATPGHTLSCVTVLVAKSNLDERPVAIAGDLFERRQDIEDERLWLEAGSEDPRAQRIHRARIASLAGWIIPGHGGPFRVDASVREKLNKQQDQAGPSTEGDVI